MKDLKIEVGKFYKTRDGRKVRIYATDAGGDYPIHGALWDDNDHRWEFTTFTDNGRSINWRFGTKAWDIISEWEDKPIFDNWDALPAWCDYSIAMDEDGAWYCYSFIPYVSDNTKKWGHETIEGVSYIKIPDNLIEGYNGDWKDSLLINPKYLQNDEK